MEKIASYHGILRKQQILKSVYNITLSCITSLRSVVFFKELYQENISPFSFSFPEMYETQSGPILYYISLPILISSSCILSYVSIVYNILELKNSLYSDSPKRGDMPIMGLVNCLNETTASGLIANFLTKINIKNSFVQDIMARPNVALISEVPLPLLHGPALLLRNYLYKSRRMGRIYEILFFVLAFANKRALYIVYKNLFQMSLNFQRLFFNQVKYVVTDQIDDINATTTFSCRASKRISDLQDWFLGTIKIEVEDLRQSANSGVCIDPPLFQAARRRPNYRGSNLAFPTGSIRQNRESTSVPNVGHTPVNTNHNDVNNQSNAPTNPASHLKFKTRGTPYPNNNDEKQPGHNNEGNEHEDDLVSWIPDDVRKEKLEYISELRLNNQVKKSIIDRELNQLTRTQGACHLPEGRRTGIDGSEQHLTWQFGMKAYAVKFETCHGSQNDQFSGAKLRKVLNVLEAAYLWQWNRTKVDTYLSQRTKNTNLEKLAYIFRERPTVPAL